MTDDRSGIREILPGILPDSSTTDPDLGPRPPPDQPGSTRLARTPGPPPPSAPRRQRAAPTARPPKRPCLGRPRGLAETVASGCPWPRGTSGGGESSLSLLPPMRSLVTPLSQLMSRPELLSLTSSSSSFMIGLVVVRGVLPRAAALVAVGLAILLVGWWTYRKRG